MKMKIKTISPAECAAKLGSEPSLELIDVRTAGEYGRAHVPGARSLPLDRLETSAFSNDRPVYVICQGGGRSARACEQLMRAGVENVYSVEGGTEAWERAGLPVTRGPSRVISLERQVRIGAGSIVLIGAALAWWVHPGFIAIPAFIGAGLVFSGITSVCGMAILLGKMPWNRSETSGEAG